MSLARAISRGAALNARLGVNGIQKASRSLGTALDRLAAAVGMGEFLLACLAPARDTWLAGTALAVARGGCYHRRRRDGAIMADKSAKTNKLKARLPRGLA